MNTKFPIFVTRSASIIIAGFVVLMVLPCNTPSVVAAGPSVSVLIQSGTPQTVISGLFPGDLVEVTIQLTTDDPNENGEGEPLVVTSSGGFQISLGAYFVPRRYTFAATKIGETIQAYIAGYDGDESALVTVSINSGVKQRFTTFQKEALADLQQQFSAIGLATKVTQTLICFGPFQVKWLCPVVGLIPFGEGILAKRIGKLALDPSDPNFTSIFTPVIPTLPLAIAPDMASLPLASSFNALVARQAEAISYAQAMQVCIDRAQGATDAGNTFWENKQLAALKKYQVKFAQALGALPALYVDFNDRLVAAGVTAFSITPQDVFSAEADLARNGFAPDEIRTFLQLGAMPGEIDEIKNIFFVQDINAVAGSFPSRLIDKGFLTALRNAALALNPDTTPPNVTATATPKLLWPPNHRKVPVTIFGTITDDLSGVETGSASYRVTDEYGVVQPSGSFAVGGNGTFSFTIPLDAWRNGTDRDGRRYNVVLNATDNAGNKTTKTLVVVVPHDQGRE